MSVPAINPDLIKGPWTPEEDEKIIKHFNDNWDALDEFLQDKTGRRMQAEELTRRQRRNAQQRRPQPKVLSHGGVPVCERCIRTSQAVTHRRRCDGAVSGSGNHAAH